MVQAKTKNKKNELSNPSSTAGKWMPLILFLLSFFIYSNTLKHQYAQDDDIYTRKNSLIQKGITAFPELVKQGSLVGFDKTNVSDYRPLVLVNFALEKTLFGNNPKANHFFNVLFYALLCVLLFSFLKKIFHEYPLYVPVLISLLFLFHPLHTEVVANIKSRDELLCFLFAVLTLNFIYDYVQGLKIKHLSYSCVSFFCCLLCKENGFTFLAVIPLLLYFFTNSSIRRIGLLTMIFTAIAGLNLLIRVVVLDALFLTKSLVLMDNSLLAARSISESIATNFTMLLKAFSLLFFPFGLSYDYSFNQFPIVNWSDYTALFSLLLYVGLGIFALSGIKKRSIFSFVILYYFITYSMTSNLLFKIGSSFAERFLFAPSLAFCIALPFLLALFFKIDLKQSSLSVASKVSMICVAVALIFSVQTYSRNPVWENSYTLFASGAASAPNSARVHFAYANEFREKVEAAQDFGMKQDAAKMALSEFQKGLDIYDKDERIYYNMGVIYFNINEIEKARTVYKKAISMKADYPEALNNLGVIYFNEKDFKNALSYFKKAVESNASYMDAYANLGACYHNSGDVKSAIPYYEKALKLNPANVNVLKNLSMAYLSIGDTAKSNYYTQKSIQ